jgi:hypothetical protein
MLIKTANLTPPQVNWAVAKCEGIEFELIDGALVTGTRFESNSADDNYGCEFNEEYDPSTDWAQGGPLLDEITIDYRDNETQARKWNGHDFVDAYAGKRQGLLAAMRCLVASKIGDEIEIPEELCK